MFELRWDTLYSSKMPVSRIKLCVAAFRRKPLRAPIVSGRNRRAPSATPARFTAAIKPHVRTCDARISITACGDQTTAGVMTTRRVRDKQVRSGRRR